MAHGDSEVPADVLAQIDAASRTMDGQPDKTMATASVAELRTLLADADDGTRPYAGADDALTSIDAKLSVIAELLCRLVEREVDTVGINRAFAAGAERAHQQLVNALRA